MTTEYCLQTRLMILDLDKYYPQSLGAKEVSEFLHTDLLIEGNHDFILKVHFEYSTYLDDKFMRWNDVQNEDPSLNEIFKISKINNSKRLSEVDFSRSKITRIKTLSDFRENGNKYFLIHMDAIELVFNYEESPEEVSTLILSNSATDLVNNLYSINTFYPNRTIWEAKLKFDSYYTFSQIQFQFGFNHYVEKDENRYKTIVKRIPKIQFRHNNISYENMKKHISLIIALVSFYQGEEIEFTILRHYNETKLYSLIKITSPGKVLKRGNLNKLKYRNELSTFVETCKVELLEIIPLVTEIVSMYNLSNRTSGSSKFLLLFSIIEKLRKNSHYLDYSTEKFNFIYKDDLLKQKLTTHLSQIKDYIIGDEKQKLFEKLIPNKIDQIKFLPQKNQFAQFFESTKVNPAAFDLEFKAVIDFRRKIFSWFIYKYRRQRVR